MNQPTKNQQAAVIYIRVARSGPASQQAIDSQRHSCQRRANELGLTVLREYVEHGPGSLGAGRSTLRKMVGDLKLLQGQVDYVITYDHARIARDMQAYVHILWAIQSTGARLEIASADHLDDNPPGTLSALVGNIGLRQHAARQLDLLGTGEGARHGEE
jgi:site-specific DNA recombinase